MAISSKIANLRKERDLTQKELSDKLGINQSVLNRIEKGTRPVRDDELKAFADFFDVSADYLIGNEKNNTFIFNEDETRLLDGYRLLDDSKRQTLFSMLSFLTSQPNSVMRF